MNRREILKGAAIAAVMPLAGSDAEAQAPAAAADPWRGLKPGVASYTLRKLPLDAAIVAIKRVGLSYVSIKDFHLKLDSTAEERKAVAAKFKEAGITPLSCGNITMQNDEADVRRAFTYARDIGLPAIVCSPDPASMPLLDKMVKEFDIRLAIHNHGPEDKLFPTPESALRVVKNMDPRCGLCIDVGHTARAGADSVEAIREAGPRLFDLHIKDSRAIARDNGCPVGEGVLPIVAIFKQLRSMNYPGTVSLEYEIEADSPFTGMKASFAYMRGVLAGLKG